MKKFNKKNEDLAFVVTPALFKEYTTTHVLVMEYIDGLGIDEKEKLLENGYDLKEIGTKLVDNYIKQVMDDGFFHADPQDRKSTRLNSSHVSISYAVFCLKKKKQ